MLRDRPTNGRREHHRRHRRPPSRAQRGHHPALGDDRFTAFATPPPQPRAAGASWRSCGPATRTTYVVNAAALACMRAHGLAGAGGGRPARDARGTTRFADEPSWRAPREALGLDRLKVAPDPGKIATEGALWGSIREHGLLDGTVIVSDDAGQFRVGQHALCWVHAERLVHKLIATRLGGGSRCIRTAPPRRVLIPHNDRQGRALDFARHQLIRWF